MVPTQPPTPCRSWKLRNATAVNSQFPRKTPGTASRSPPTAPATSKTPSHRQGGQAARRPPGSVGPEDHALRTEALLCVPRARQGRGVRLSLVQSRLPRLTANSTAEAPPGLRGRSRALGLGPSLTGQTHATPPSHAPAWGPPPSPGPHPAPVWARLVPSPGRLQQLGDTCLGTSCPLPAWPQPHPEGPPACSVPQGLRPLALLVQARMACTVEALPRPPHKAPEHPTPATLCTPLALPCDLLHGRRRAPARPASTVREPTPDRPSRSAGRPSVRSRAPGGARPVARHRPCGAEGVEAQHVWAATPGPLPATGSARRRWCAASPRRNLAALLELNAQRGDTAGGPLGAAGASPPPRRGPQAGPALSPADAVSRLCSRCRERRGRSRGWGRPQMDPCRPHEAAGPPPPRCWQGWEPPPSRPAVPTDLRGPQTLPGPGASFVYFIFYFFEVLWSERLLNRTNHQARPQRSWL